jgi:hypothetical protein
MRGFFRRPLLYAFLLLAVLAAAAFASGPLTTKGTQPPLNFPIYAPFECGQCHMSYDAKHNIEPFDTWQGSMMAQASRDPFFWAALDVANHDLPNSGDFCLRCHVPTPWLDGRTSPPSSNNDGCGLIGELDGTDADFDGVSCHLCHRMMENKTPPPGQSRLYYENANFWLDDSTCANGEPCRRGPYNYPQDGVAPPHAWAYSPLHTSSRLCGNCHNVTNPAVTMIKNGVDTGIPMPVERTFREWQQSSFSDSLAAGYKACQDCHMPNVAIDSVYACSLKKNIRANNMRIHQFAGGNAWVPDVLRQEYPALNMDANLAATRDWALDMLQNQSAQVAINAPTSIEGGRALSLSVKVTNLTGHKLPTGYPEGRRMWINVQIRDANDAIVYESGAYNPATGVLTHDAQAKVYEVKQGIHNLNGTGGCDVADNNGGAIFHFVKNNCFALDNRIPPLGFTGKNDMEIQPVNYVYPETAPASGILVNYDVTQYAVTIPADTPSPLRVTATLRYQTASKEYVGFLKDEAVNNNFPDDCIPRSTGMPTMSRGEIIYDMWSRHELCPPVDMGTALASVTVTKSAGTPKSLALEQNYPNPMRATGGTRIAFQLPGSGPVRLDIYDIAGRRVRTLVNSTMTPGAKSAYWDGLDDSGQTVASGVYLYRLVVNGQLLSKRLVIVR